MCRDHIMGGNLSKVEEEAGKIKTFHQINEHQAFFNATSASRHASEHNWQQCVALMLWMEEGKGCAILYFYLHL